MLIVPKPVVFPNDEQVEDDKTVGQLEANRNQGQHWTIVYCHTRPILEFQLS